jgi:hypothetical protein
MPVKAEFSPILPSLSPVCGRAIVARFDSARMSSDSGLLVLREVDQHLGLAPRLAACIPDPRALNRVVHGLDEIIRTRLLMIAAGYEDGNDADRLRSDPMFKLAMGRLPDGTERWPVSSRRRFGFYKWSLCRLMGPPLPPGCCGGRA